jgi:hypothetical protein
MTAQKELLHRLRNRAPPGVKDLATAEHCAHVRPPRVPTHPTAASRLSAPEQRGRFADAGRRPCHRRPPRWPNPGAPVSVAPIPAGLRTGVPASPRASSAAAGRGPFLSPRH